MIVLRHLLYLILSRDKRLPDSLIQTPSLYTYYAYNRENYNLLLSTTYMVRKSKCHYL